MTTRTGTWTVPHSEDQKVEFFHSEEWDELHVVHQETKLLLAIYSRDQVLSMVSRNGAKRKKARNGTDVTVLSIN